MSKAVCVSSELWSANTAANLTPIASYNIPQLCTGRYRQITMLDPASQYVKTLSYGIGTITQSRHTRQGEQKRSLWAVYMRHKRAGPRVKLVVMMKGHISLG